MGPTEAGFLFGCALLDLDLTVHLVSVEYDAEELAGRIAGIVDGLAPHSGRTPGDWQRRMALHMAQLRGGYRRPTPESVAAVAHRARLGGFLLHQPTTPKPFPAPPPT